MADIVKARREGMRWNIIVALDKARPIGAMDVLLLDVVRCIYADATPNELQQQLDYLAGRKMVDIDKRADGHWYAKLTALGVDIAEYTVECREGIARPKKYWG
ncbi:MAG: hypothetical protein CR991_11860 [Proteobacteria bacterium]|nr:MAG: hypothetical protein CR991_11860 [Pseudomonadota bacterium]